MASLDDGTSYNSDEDSSPPSSSAAKRKATCAPAPDGSVEDELQKENEAWKQEVKKLHLQIEAVRDSKTPVLWENKELKEKVKVTEAQLKETEDTAKMWKDLEKITAGKLVEEQERSQRRLDKDFKFKGERDLAIDQRQMQQRLVKAREMQVDALVEFIDMNAARGDIPIHLKEFSHFFTKVTDMEEKGQWEPF